MAAGNDSFAQRWKLTMSHLDNLGPEDQAKVNAKLADLQQKTGQLWACEVMKKPERSDGTYLLEIKVDGHISRPVILDHEESKPGDRICKELDWAYEGQ
jgi:hypothetical protein